MLKGTRLPGLGLRVLQRTGHQILIQRGMVEGRKGLIIGVWEPCGEEQKVTLTQHAAKLNDQLSGSIMERFKNYFPKKGEVEITHDLAGFYAVALAGIGPETCGYDDNEKLHVCRELIRRAVAKATHRLNEQEVATICVDPMMCADAACEGAKLSNWTYQDFKSPPRSNNPEINMFSTDERDQEAWEKATYTVDGQNVARWITETPANVMTPKIFCEEAIKILCPCGVHVNVRPLRWIEDQKMFAFLNIARGSCQPPYFLEINYCGGAEGDRPVVFCGKGCTFDSGGLCLKTCASASSNALTDMSEKKGSCTGAAAIIGAIKAMARLSVPVNAVGLIPVFENMPSGLAMKPGDVVMASDGRTIVIEDTDNEGRLALADVLLYSEHFKACLTATIGNFCEGPRQAFGSVATPTYATSNIVYEELEKAGAFTGDRVWRMPLWQDYKKRVSICPHVDVCNTGLGYPHANMSLAAAFLSKFVPGCDFFHMDTTSTGLVTRGSTPYYKKGFMTGRPVRTLVQFMKNMACPLDKESTCSAK